MHTPTSSADTHDLVEAQYTSRLRGLSRFVTEQPPYSIFSRAVEADVLPVARRHDIGVLTWSPLGGGWLTGALRRGGGDVSDRADLMPGLFDTDNPANAGKLDAVEKLLALAGDAGMSLIHLALAFVLTHPAVDTAIIGPRDSEQLDSQLEAAEMTLDAEILDAIDAINAPGHNMTERDAGYTPPELGEAQLRRRQRV